MMIDNLKKGTAVFDIRYGWGQVTNIWTLDYKYPIGVEFLSGHSDTYSKEGFSEEYHKVPLLSRNEYFLDNRTDELDIVGYWVTLPHNPEFIFYVQGNITESANQVLQGFGWGYVGWYTESVAISKENFESLILADMEVVNNRIKQEIIDRGYIGNYLKVLVGSEKGEVSEVVIPEDFKVVGEFGDFKVSFSDKSGTRFIYTIINEGDWAEIHACIEVLSVEYAERLLATYLNREVKISNQQSVWGV